MKRNRLADSSGMAAVGAMPTGLRPRENVRLGVFQLPYRGRQSVSAAASVLIIHEMEINFPETVPFNS